MFIENLPNVLFLNKSEIPIFWLAIPAGYLIIEAENTLPPLIDGLMLELNGEGFRYPAPPMLMFAEEVKISIPGKLVSEKALDEKEIIKLNSFR